jgi:hypothetical protein
LADNKAFAQTRQLMTKSNQEIAKYLADFSRTNKCSFSVTLSNGVTSKQNSWVIIPTDKYIEFEYTGPLTFNQIKWVDIDPIVVEKIGNRIPSKTIDNSNQIILELTNKHISYTVIDKNIRLAFQ